MLADDSLSPIWSNPKFQLYQFSMDLTRQMQSQPYLLSFFKTMLTDDSLSPIFDYHQKFLFPFWNMTCYIVKACHLLGNLTDGSLSPEKCEGKPNTFLKDVAQRRCSHSPIFQQVDRWQPQPLQEIGFEISLGAIFKNLTLFLLIWHNADAATALFKDSSANYVICHHFQSGFFKKQSKAFLSNLVAV